jgi:hypothetical protein
VCDGDLALSIDARRVFGVIAKERIKYCKMKSWGGIEDIIMVKCCDEFAFYEGIGSVAETDGDIGFNSSDARFREVQIA